MPAHKLPTEQSPLLQDQQDPREVKIFTSAHFRPEPRQLTFFCQFIKFGKRDAEDPRQWSRAKKLINVAVIACMAGSYIFPSPSPPPPFYIYIYKLPFNLVDLRCFKIKKNIDETLPVMSPLASSMFAPGIDQIASDLGVDQAAVIGATTGFVICLGLGPLVLAPLSENFGRRKLYLWCFGIFSILQIPTALSPNIQTFLVARTISGFFGSW